MPHCVSCYCPVRRRRNKCTSCFSDPPPLQWLDVSEPPICAWCDSPLCALHASQHQLAHQLCAACYEQRNSSADEESEWSRAAPSRWDDDDLEEDEPAAPEWDEWEEELVRDSKRRKQIVYSQTGTSEDKCSICLDAMIAPTQIVHLPCFGDHAFHTNCIVTWLDKSSHCPLCHTEVHVQIDDS